MHMQSKSSKGTPYWSNFEQLVEPMSIETWSEQCTTTMGTISTILHERYALISFKFEKSNYLNV